MHCALSMVEDTNMIYKITQNIELGKGGGIVSAYYAYVIMQYQYRTIYTYIVYTSPSDSTFH